VKPEPAEKGVYAAIKKNYKVNFDFDINKPLQKKDVLLIAGKLSQVKKLTES
jgi:hypothetical protein